MNMVSLSKRLILIASCSAVALSASTPKKAEGRNYLTSNIRAYLTLINNGLEQDKTAHNAEDIFAWLQLNDKREFDLRKL